MNSLFRKLFLAAAVCAAMLSLSLLRGATPVVTADESGWILPGANVGTGWNIRLKDARAEAAKEGKPILILFSGPDWSTGCKKFEASVLKSREFMSQVRSGVVGLYIQHFVTITAPEEQVSSNQSLRKALAVPPVYPCTVILASDGKKILGIIQGAPDRNTYIQQVAGIAGIDLQK